VALVAEAGTVVVAGAYAARPAVTATLTEQVEARGWSLMAMSASMTAALMDPERTGMGEWRVDVMAVLVVGVVQ